MSVSAAIAWLSSRHGDDKARRLARLEQQRARRARSRKRFNFWAVVAAELDGGARLVSHKAFDNFVFGAGRVEHRAAFLEAATMPLAIEVRAGRPAKSARLDFLCEAVGATN